MEPTKTKIISYSIPLTSPLRGYSGWRVRFSYESDCGRTHTATAENCWGSSETYFRDIRDIRCKDVEDRCPDEQVTTTVELFHPNRTMNDGRHGELQKFHAIPNWGAGLGR